MYTKWGLIVTKQEMMKIWVDSVFTPVTLVKVLPQEVLRYKTLEKDGYAAVVVGVEKKSEDKKLRKNELPFSKLVEFSINDSFVEKYKEGDVLDATALEWIETVSVVGTSKWKGFQGIIKRRNMITGWATHGHKFTRAGASKGNRKPRRVQKWHPLPGHMGSEKIILKKIKLLDVIQNDQETLLVLKGSLPGHKNAQLKLILE